MSWRPLSLRGKAEARFDEPVEGFPAWLRNPVLEWVERSFFPGPYENAEARQALQLAFRLETPLRAQGGRLGAVSDLMGRMNKDEEFALDVLDWMLYRWQYFSENYELHQWTQKLNEILRQGGSAWEVTESGNAYQLSRRAIGPVRDVLEHTATEATRAHDHLTAAWSKLTGRQPDPSSAYRESVRAVEAVAKPIILPDNARATLGQMITALKDKPEKWKTTIGTVNDVCAQMEAVWTGQLDRHGTDDETVPLNVSPAEADAAFSACLNLVRLFVGGHVVRED